MKLLLDENISPKVAEKLAHDPGIIMLEDGALPRDKQLRMVRAALTTLPEIGDLTNKVLWVEADGSTTVEDVPPP